MTEMCGDGVSRGWGERVDSSLTSVVKEARERWQLQKEVQKSNQSCYSFSRVWEHYEIKDSEMRYGSCLTSRKIGRKYCCLCLLDWPNSGAYYDRIFTVLLKYQTSLFFFSFTRHYSKVWVYFRQIINVINNFPVTKVDPLLPKQKLITTEYLKMVSTNSSEGFE